MEHFFSLNVDYNGKTLHLPARLQTYGYTFKFFVMVDKQEIIFERDDEMNYRAMAAGTKHSPVEPELLEAIVKSLEELPGTGTGK
jgi:hypothetical protein